MVRTKCAKCTFRRAGLAGTLRIPERAHALVVFALGSGSSRFSPHNMAVAEALNAQGIATLLFDLLTMEEDTDRANVFNIVGRAACSGRALARAGADSARKLVVLRFPQHVA
jgi:hypothetical protein